MKEKEIIVLFDDEKYQEIFDMINPYDSYNIKEYELLYYLKSKLALSDFEIKNVNEVKKLLFFYFYLLGEVEFENNYSIIIKKDLLKITSLNDDVSELGNFKQYFDLGKNTVFLNKIYDKTLSVEPLDEGAVEVDNIIDFLLYFIHECSELYAFSGEHFPLFKWLINELVD